jgi:hypothetical protein
VAESLTKLVVNCETNESQVIKLTAAEITEINKTAAASKIRLENEAAEAQSKATAKAALLEKLGIRARKRLSYCHDQRQADRSSY